MRYRVEGSEHAQRVDVPENVTASNWTLTGLINIVTYSIEVAAVNSAGIGPYTESVLVKTKQSKLVPLLRCRHCICASTYIHIDVYISQGDLTIANHSYLAISNDTHLACISNYISNIDETYVGDWYAPDGTSIGSFNVNSNQSFGTWRSENPTTIHLRRKSPTNLLEGIFHCEIWDVATGVQRLYVGLYSSGGGQIQLCRIACIFVSFYTIFYQVIL